jgi:hypothetical protein
MTLRAELCIRQDQPLERCCFCFGVLEARICQLSNGKHLHPDCLPALLQALEIESIELTDGNETTQLAGWRQGAPWPC